MAKDKKKKKNKILIIIFIVCIAVAVFAGYRLIDIGLTYKQAEDEYINLQQYTVSVAQGDASATQSESDEELETVTPPIEVDFEALWEINSDIVGWLYLAAEEISYPIVQADDNDYYLYRTVEGTENASGSIFMEYQNSSDFSDPNTIIYGHNMRDLSMFGSLQHLYTYEDYLIDDTFWVITPDAAYRYNIFNMEYTVSDGDVYVLFSGPSELVTNYIEGRINNSLVDFGIEEYDENSKIVTLSTCTSSSGEGRFVVQGILTWEGDNS